MNKKVRWLLGVLAIIGAIYYSFIKFVVPGYLAQVPPLVSQLAKEYITGTVDIERLEWNGAFKLTAFDVQVNDKKQQPIALLPSVEVYIAPWHGLFNTNKILDRVVLDKPTVYLTLDEKDAWNVQDFLKPSDSEETPFYGLLEINDGSVITDTPYGKWDFGLNASVDGGGNPKFALDTKLAHDGDTLELKGLVDMKSVGNLNLKSDRFNLNSFAALAEEFAHVKNFHGAVADVNLLWGNDGKNVTMSGAAVLDKLTGVAVYEDLQLPVGIDGKVSFNDKAVQVANMLLTVEQQTAQLDGEVDFKDRDNIQGSGLLAADLLNIKNEEFKKVKVPFRIIDNKAQINTAQAEFGGGLINLLAEYDIGAGDLVAALDLKNIKMKPIEARPDEIVAIDGSMAMKGVIKDEDFKVNLAANTLKLGWQDLLLHKLTFDIDVDKDGAKIKNLAGFTETGAFLAQGDVNSDAAFKMHGSATEFPIGQLLKAAGQDGSGLLVADFAVSGTSDAINFAGFTQLKQAEIAGLKITEAYGNVAMQDNVIAIKDYKIKMEQGESIANGTVDLSGSEPVLNLALVTDGVRAEPFVQAFAPGVKLTGNVNNKMLVQGSVSMPSVVGNFCLTDGSAEGYLIDKIETDYSYINNELVIKDCDIIALSAEAKLNGKLDSAQNLDFKVDLKSVDLSSLPISDDAVALEGYVNAEGTLTGTLSKPFFQGDVNSDSIFINGEELTHIECKLDSDGVKNHLIGSFKQAPEGVFSTELDYESDQKFLHGNIVAMYGNVRSTLKMAKTDLAIDGLVQGEVAINPHGPKSGLFVDVWVDDIAIRDLKYQEMKFKGHLQDKVWYFDDVKLMETKAVTDKGLIAVGGQVNLGDDSMNLELAALDANPALVTAFMSDPVTLTGDLNMFVQLHGSLKEPQGNGSIEVKNGTVADIGFDDFTAMLSLTNDNLKLEQAMVSKDIYKASAHGDVPLDIFRSKEQRRDPNAQMNVELNLDNTRLGILQVISPMVEWGVGETQGQVKLAGTLEEPLVYGSIKIPDGSLKFKHARTVIENIHTDVVFEGNKIEFKDISAKLGKGTFKGNGTYALRSSEKEAYQLNLLADNAEIASDIFTGRINCNMSVTPQRYVIRDEAGNMQTTSNGRPQFDYRPLIKGEIRLDDVLVNMPTIPEFGEGQSNYGLDLQVTMGPKIHLYNKYLYDLWLAGDLRIEGSTLFTTIGGNVSVKRGTISYLRTQFKMRNASVAWPIPGTVLPTVNLEATSKFHRYNIEMQVKGPLEEMDMQLTSSPPLTKDQIVRMLTLQREAVSSDDLESDDLQNIMTAGLEMAVFGDVEQMFKQSLGLDEFRIYSGKLRSGVEIDTSRTRDLTPDERNQYNILFSKYLTNNFMVGYTTSMDNDHNSIFGQLEISRHININYSRNKDNDVNDNWYGLEYRVTF